MFLVQCIEDKTQHVCVSALEPLCPRTPRSQPSGMLPGASAAANGGGDPPSPRPSSALAAHRVSFLRCLLVAETSRPAPCFRPPLSEGGETISLAKTTSAASEKSQVTNDPIVTSQKQLNCVETSKDKVQIATGRRLGISTGGSTRRGVNPACPARRVSFKVRASVAARRSRLLDARAACRSSASGALGAGTGCIGVAALASRFQELISEGGAGAADGSGALLTSATRKANGCVLRRGGGGGDGGGRRLTRKSSRASSGSSSTSVAAIAGLLQEPLLGARAAGAGAGSAAVDAEEAMQTVNVRAAIQIFESVATSASGPTLSATRSRRPSRPPATSAVPSHVTGATSARGGLCATTRRLNGGTLVRPRGSDAPAVKPATVPVASRIQVQTSIREQKSQRLRPDANAQEKEVKGKAEVKKDVERKVEVKEDVGKNAEVKEDVGKKAEVKEDVGKKAEVKEDVGKKVEVIENVGKKVEVKEDVGKKVEVKEDVGKKAEVKEDVGKKAEVKGDVAKKVEVKEDVGKKIEVMENVERKAEVMKDVERKVEVKEGVEQKPEEKKDLELKDEGKEKSKRGQAESPRPLMGSLEPNASFLWRGGTTSTPTPTSAAIPPNPTSPPPPLPFPPRSLAPPEEKDEEEALYDDILAPAISSEDQDYQDIGPPGSSSSEQQLSEDIYESCNEEVYDDCAPAPPPLPPKPNGDDVEEAEEALYDDVRALLPMRVAETQSLMSNCYESIGGGSMVLRPGSSCDHNNSLYTPGSVRSVPSARTASPASGSDGNDTYAPSSVASGDTSAASGETSEWMDVDVSDTESMRVQHPHLLLQDRSRIRKSPNWSRKVRDQWTKNHQSSNDGEGSAKQKPDGEVTHTTWYTESGLFDSNTDSLVKRSPRPKKPNSSNWYAAMGVWNDVVTGVVVKESDPSEGSVTSEKPAEVQERPSHFLQDEPLYQFYIGTLAEMAQNDAEGKFDSDGYEEITYKSLKLPSRPTAMELIQPRKGQHRVCTLWSEVPDVVQSQVLSTLNQHDIRLQEAKFEIITSEASYINSLDVLESYFMSSPELNDDSVLPKADRKILFGNVIPVKKCSENFLADLEKCWQENILLHGICDTVLAHAPKFSDVYVKYCKNQNYRNRILQELIEQKGQFAEVLKRLEGSSKCEHLTLHSFLMLPMQRITRLPLLIDAVHNRLHPDDEEYQSSKLALATLNKIVHECNEGARHMQRLEQIFMLSNQLEFPKEVKHVPIMQSSRYLVRCGEVVQLIWREDAKLTFGKKMSKASLYLFLFSDLLVVTKKKSEENFTVLDYCPRNLVQVSCSEEMFRLPIKSIEAGRNLLLLTMLENHENKMTEMVLSCAGVSDKERWYEALSQPISDNPEETVYEEWDCPQVVALHPYTASQPDELSLEVNDAVNVLRKMTDGWYQGERIRDGERGWFPGNHCAEIVSAHVRARNLKQRYRLLALSGNFLERQKERVK